MISAAIRDIAIIFVAVEILILNALLVILVWQVWRLVKMVQREVKPIITDGQETVGVVKGTAEFVSESFVTPLVTAGGRWAAFRRSVKVMQSELRTSMEAVSAVLPSRERRPDPSDGAPPTG